MIEEIQKLQTLYLNKNTKYASIKVIILPHTFCTERMNTDYEYQTDWYDSIEEVINWFTENI